MTRKDGARFYNDRKNKLRPRYYGAVARPVEYCDQAKREKAVYPDLFAAKAVLTSIRYTAQKYDDFAQKHLEARAYYCDDCHGYHLSRDRVEKTTRLSAKAINALRMFGSLKITGDDDRNKPVSERIADDIFSDRASAEK